MSAVRLTTLLLLSALISLSSTTYAERPSYQERYGNSKQQKNEIITVQASQFGASLTIGGTVVPYREVTLAAQLPGRIEYIAGREGDQFEPGVMLAVIDNKELLAKRRQIMADLANVNAARRNAYMQYTREMWAPKSTSISRMPGMGMPALFDNMFTRNLGSSMGYGVPALERHSDLYSSWTDLSQSQSRILQTRSMVDEIDARLDDTLSIAPFRGVITKKLVEVGDTIQPGQPLLVFADTQHLQIKVDVQARLVPGLKRGMVVPALLDVGDRRIDVRVAQIFPIADEQRHTVTVKFDMPGSVPGGPGMYAEVMIPDIDSPEQRVPVIPTAAIVQRGSLPSVFIINDQGRTELRWVRVGNNMGGNMTSILSGLQEGDRILANPSTGIGSGQAVERENRSYTR